MKRLNSLWLTGFVAMGTFCLVAGCEKNEPAPAKPAAPAVSTPSAKTAPETTPPADKPAEAAKPAEKQADKPAAAASGKGKKYTIGVIAKSQSNPVFVAAHTGAVAAAKDLSAKYGIEVIIDWRTPANEDAQQQAQYLEQLVSTGVSGISLSCTDAKVLTAAINSAADKGVPVITFDSDAPDSKRIAYYGMDDYDCGKQLMSEMSKLLNGKGTIAILGGNQNAPNLQKRIAGAKDEMKNHPGLKLKDSYYHGETAPEAVAKIEQVQGANPDIAGWVMVGGWPLFTENALDKIAPAKVVSVDTLPQELNYVKKGQVQVLLGQKCYGWGYETVTMLVEKLHNNKTPKVINSFVPDRVTKDNVSEFYGLWDTWLGKNAGK
jgi:ribose transport system substrate-binding protein